MTKHFLSCLFGSLWLVGCAVLPNSSESTAATEFTPANPQATSEKEVETEKEQAVISEQIVFDHLGREVGVDVRPPSIPLPPYPLTQRQVHPAVVAAQHRRIFPEPKWRNPRPSIAQPMRTQLMHQGSGSATLCQAFHHRVKEDIWIDEGSWTDWILYGGSTNGIRGVSLKVHKELPLNPVPFGFIFVDLDHNGVYELLHFVDHNLSSQMMHETLYLLGEASAEEVNTLINGKAEPVVPHGPPYTEDEEWLLFQAARELVLKQDRIRSAIADRLLARYNTPEGRASSKGPFSFAEDPPNYFFYSRNELAIPYLALFGSTPEDADSERFFVQPIQLQDRHYLMFLNRTRKQTFLVGLDTQTRFIGGYGGYPFKLLCRVDFFKK